jgi:hypothetical protein
VHRRQLSADPANTWRVRRRVIVQKLVGTTITQLAG